MIQRRSIWNIGGNLWIYPGIGWAYMYIYTAYADLFRICSGNKRFELLGDEKIWLVVSKPTLLKNMLVKFGNLPQFSGWKEKMFELPPPRNCLSFKVSNTWVLKPMGIGDRTSVLHKVIIRDVSLDCIMKTWLLMGGGASQVKSYVYIYIYMQYTYIYTCNIYIYIIL